MNLTITDGFKLGCGLLLALASAAAVLLANTLKQAGQIEAAEAANARWLPR